jgi:thioredoxin reductase
MTGSAAPLILVVAPDDAVLGRLVADVGPSLRCRLRRRDEDGYVLTGRTLLQETRVPGIFAAGDVRHGSIKRVASAVGEGAVTMRMVHERLAAGAGG